jgi:predicted porin
MKRSIVALAALAAAGAASAQSSVTLFGLLDAAISHLTVKSAFYNNTGLLVVPPFAAPVGVERSQTVMRPSGYNSSRLGFRGTEDLGGGLAAGFWLEADVANDTGLGGAPGGLLNFNRRSTVSLSGGFGELRLGRDYVPTFWNNTAFDPFGTNGVGTNLIHQVETNLHTVRGPGSIQGASDNYLRSSNSIGYFLPPDLGGFYGQLMYALHENVKFSDTAGSPSKRGRYIGGRVGYANGPFNIAGSYGESTAADVTGLTAAGLPTGINSDNKLKTVNLGVSWDFGPVKVFGEVSRVKDELETTTPILGGLAVLTATDKDKYTGGLLGATIPIGVGQVRVAYSRVKYKNDLGPASPTLFAIDRDASASKFAIGYVHNLSKRTALYATAARVRIKDGQNNPAIMGVTNGGPAFLSTGAGTVGYAPRSATGYDFGVRHAF